MTDVITRKVLVVSTFFLAIIIFIVSIQIVDNAKTIENLRCEVEMLKEDVEYLTLENSSQAKRIEVLEGL